MIAWILAAFSVPIIGGICTLIIPRGWVKAFSQIIAFSAFVCSLVSLVLLGMQGQESVTFDLIQMAGMVVLGIVADKLSSLVGLAVILVGFLVVVYSTGYLSPGNLEHPEHEVKRRYYFFLLLFIGAMAGLVYSSTMIGMLVFFELTGICSWGLIGYYDDAKAQKSALKAVITTQVGSLGLYVATAVFLVQCGSTQLSLLADQPAWAKTIIFSGVLIAAWSKSAQLPFHFWLPDAMVAPTPISAYLHAASMVKAGVYVFARCLLSGGEVPTTIGMLGAVMAVLTMIYGFIMYFPQRDLKRLLAYSTITQLSYIFLALSVSIYGSPIAFNGAVAHIFNHAFAKGLFFLVAGTLSYAAGTKMLPSIRGVMSKMPIVGLSFVIAMLGVSGVPPFNGFFSKFSIFIGSFTTAASHAFLMVLVVVAFLETIGSFAWIFWVYGTTMLGEPSPSVESAIRPAPQIQFVLVVLAILTLCSGYFAVVWLG